MGSRCWRSYALFLRCLVTCLLFPGQAVWWADGPQHSKPCISRALFPSVIFSSATFCLPILLVFIKYQVRTREEELKLQKYQICGNAGCAILMLINGMKVKMSCVMETIGKPDQRDLVPYSKTMARPFGVFSHILKLWWCCSPELDLYLKNMEHPEQRRYGYGQGSCLPLASPKSLVSKVQR